jgi:rhamnose utilization protein RhaD (predicted bifunctional aldolase and dehydrogenase)/NAD(P)-dependent dehydrogenase (short-subunit alcohol dehydrogenase family)
MLKLLKDLWDPQGIDNELELLRYRSNLLGADLRITNFGGGNTSSKIAMTDPFTGQSTTVLAVKGSGGDLGSIKTSGFALLYMDKLNQLKNVYKGEDLEDEIVAYYPLCAFGTSSAPASIDTPLHAFLPFPHVDHLHPDWAIAIAASANGKAKLEEFNRRFQHNVIWLPWQRPGFELGLMLQRAVEANPDCDGIILGSHGLFTWGDTQESCYRNSLKMIDDMGQFVQEHEQKAGSNLFGGPRYKALVNAQDIAVSILPFLRGRIATARRSIGHYDTSADVMQFVDSTHAPELAALGTSCPDHFIRTRIAPLYVDWDPASGIDPLKEAIASGLERYRSTYTDYYNANKEPESPALRDANPSVVLIPGVGMFTFAKNKKEARITAEFYINAIHVMAGATAMGAGAAKAAAAGSDSILPQAKTAEVASSFTSLYNYVALPPREAFRIEYWALEEAKIRRMPREQEFSRKVFIVVGGGSGIGRAVVLQLAGLGAHLVAADKNSDAAHETAQLAAKAAGSEAVASCGIDICDRASIRAALQATIQKFGGVDGIINTAAIFLSPPADGSLDEQHWRTTLDVNVTGNFLLADEARKVLLEQGLPATVVLTSSANAVVPKRGSEAYDVSKSAVNHLIGELAVGLKPLVRVNGIAPATVVEGSTMFPRERLIPSLKKYDLPAGDDEPTEVLRDRLAQFYAKRTLTGIPIRPQDCAEAIVWLASDRSAKTTGHVIPVDGGLPEAFLR